MPLAQDYKVIQEFLLDRLVEPLDLGVGVSRTEGSPSVYEPKL